MPSQKKLTAQQRKKTFSRKAAVSSTLADKNRKKAALPPGKRTSRTGKVYYENRLNRADGDRRKRV